MPDKQEISLHAVAGPAGRGCALCAAATTRLCHAPPHGGSPPAYRHGHRSDGAQAAVGFARAGPDTREHGQDQRVLARRGPVLPGCGVLAGPGKWCDQSRWTWAWTNAWPCCAAVSPSAASRSRTKWAAFPWPVARAGLRNVLPACLLALTDRAAAPAEVALTAQPDSGQVVLTVAVRHGQGSPRVRERSAVSAAGVARSRGIGPDTTALRSTCAANRFASPSRPPEKKAARAVAPRAEHQRRLALLSRCCGDHESPQRIPFIGCRRFRRGDEMSRPSRSSSSETRRPITRSTIL